MMTEISIPKPANSIVQVSETGEPWIRGYRCEECGAVAAAPSMACRRCHSRRAPEPFRASRRGKLHTWTVVERSYPGISVPFLSAIVDLEDGLVLKGTLKCADAGVLEEGLPIELVFDDAGGARDKEGSSYVGYHFVAAASAATQGGQA